MTEKTAQKPVSWDSLSIELAIGLITVPALGALVGAKVLSAVAHDLGQWSEEVFRGDRLPLLNIPPSAPSDS